jgi:hypothetical protein
VGKRMRKEKKIRLGHLYQNGKKVAEKMEETKLRFKIFYYQNYSLTNKTAIHQSPLLHFSYLAVFFTEKLQVKN